MNERAKNITNYSFQLSHDFSVMEILKVITMNSAKTLISFQLSHDFSVMEIQWMNTTPISTPSVSIEPRLFSHGNMILNDLDRISNGV